MPVEVEEKVKVLSDPAFTLQRIDMLAVKGVSERTVDMYLTHPSNDLKNSPRRLRIRMDDDRKVTVDYKDYQKVAKDAALVADEVILGTDSLEMTELLFRCLGFEPWMTVDKGSKLWETENLKISLDIIEGLPGLYLEIEAKDGAFTSEEDASNAIADILNRLCIEYDTIREGYPNLVLKAQEEAASSDFYSRLPEKM